MARTVYTGEQRGAHLVRPDIHGTNGRPRAADPEGVPALRSARLAIQGQPARHVRSNESEGELQELRTWSAGKADQDGARTREDRRRQMSKVAALPVSNVDHFAGR